MSFGERVRHEVREIGLVTLYFLTCFLLFLSLKKLLLAQYEVETSVLHTAVIGALVVAKVVVLLEKSRFGDLFRGARRAVHVLWRSLCYTAAVFVVTLGERLFDLHREHGGLSSAVGELWAGRDLAHFLAMNLAVGIAFVVYNGYAELEAVLGEGGLRRVFFSKRAA